ncbi:MAG: peptidoglycan-binding protein [Eubacteriales bacterium]
MKKKFGNKRQGDTVVYIESYNERTARIKKKSPAVFTGFDPTPNIPASKKSRSFLNKRKMFFIAASLAVVLSVPLIFATASNTNEVTKAAAISTYVIAAPASPLPKAEESPAAEGGELTSDLTEEAVVSATTAPADLPAQSADLNAAAVSALPLAYTVPESGYSVLTSGVSDPFVAMVQQRLMDLFYMEQDEPTPLYGPVTKQAVEDFQRNNGLVQSGTADIDTQSVLFSPSAKPYIVCLNDSGPDVQTIQDRLIELGYSAQSTGVYDADTVKAVQLFQTYNNLSDDGNVGNDTQRVLYSQDAISATNGKKSNTGAKHTTGTSKPAAPANPNKVEAFISAAMSELGKTYVLGGKGPTVFDCSGLVYYSLKASGNGIGYMTSYDWADAGQYARIGSMKDLQRGDVVCESGHVGIYMGNGQIVNASSSNGQVIVSTNIFSSSYWVGHFICGRRPL